MTSESAFNTFCNGVSGYLTSSIFPALIRGLAEKGVSVSMDDLLEMSKIPTPKPSIAIPSISMPSISFGGSSMQSASRGQEKHSGGTCSYVFQRGANKNNVCTKKTASGSEFCSGHDPNKVTVAKPQTTVPGIAPSAVPAPQLNVTAPTGLTATDYDKERGLYREVNHGFILRRNGNSIVVLGCDSEQGMVSLTDQQRSIAQSLGLEIEAKEPVSFIEIIQPSAEQVVPDPSLGLPSLKPMANMGIPTLQTVQETSLGFPSIPLLKPMTGIPTIPSLSSMMAPKQDQFSGIPSVRPVPMLSQMS